MKKRMPSLGMYITNSILLMFPWLTIGEQKYNLFQFTFRLIRDGAETLILENGITGMNMTQLKLGIAMEIVLFVIYIVLSLIYIVKMFLGKPTKLNRISLGFYVAIIVLHASSVSLCAFTLAFTDLAIPFAIFIITALEFPVREIVERWDEAIEEANRQKAEAEAERLEEEERLRFDGKYTKMFYFYVWKNFKRNWKDYNFYDGKLIENEEEKIEGMTIYQGMTRLVLMKADENVLGQIDKKLDDFEERKLQEEKDLFKIYYKKGVYDYSVSYHYMKDAAVKNLLTERLMKMTMNGLVIIVFFLMNLMLVIIKLLSEMELNLRRTEFLTCMGMRKKERIRLMRKELLHHYYLLPAVAAAFFAVIYTACVFHARMYSQVDISAFLGNMIPLWIGYFILNTLVMWIVATVYAHRIEGKENGRSS